VGRYIVLRLIIAIPTLIAITFVVFALLSLAPTDPLAQFAADPACRRRSANGSATPSA